MSSRVILLNLAAILWLRSSLLTPEFVALVALWLPRVVGNLRRRWPSYGWWTLRPTPAELVLGALEIALLLSIPPYVLLPDFYHYLLIFLLFEVVADTIPLPALDRGPRGIRALLESTFDLESFREFIRAQIPKDIQVDISIDANKFDTVIGSTITQVQNHTHSLDLLYSALLKARPRLQAEIQAARLSEEHHTPQGENATQS